MSEAASAQVREGQPWQRLRQSRASAAERCARRGAPSRSRRRCLVAWPPLLAPVRTLAESAALMEALVRAGAVCGARSRLLGLGNLGTATAGKSQGEARADTCANNLVGVSRVAAKLN